MRLRFPEAALLALSLSLSWGVADAAEDVPTHGGAQTAATPAEGPPLAFNRDILPILSNNCFACHGPDAPARKGGVRLDREEEARQPGKSGTAAIVPGEPSASALVHRVFSTDPEEQMPPPESGKSLNDTEKNLLERWIAQGAVWEPHWAFITPQKPSLPKINNTSWPTNELDHFVLAQLEANGLVPATEADPYTLIRRVSLDLTGLPPTPEEIRGFVDDPSPTAYEDLVDRLLASPHYGEHRARQWLDLARYADTNGYAADIERTMWRYRDWVIDAFNADMPFDQFSIEQLAGDLLPEPTLDQQIATGFNRNHPIMMEGGAIFEEYRVQNVLDRVDTTATTWLGLTIKCAQCHDHKYDPISQREFYQFYAFFNNISEEESKLFGTELDGNSLPRIKAPLPKQRTEAKALNEALTDVRERKLRPIVEVDQGQAAWEHAERQALAERWIACDTTTETEDTVTFSWNTTSTALSAFRMDVRPDDVDTPDPPFTLQEVSLATRPLGSQAGPTPLTIVESVGSTGDVRRAYDGDGESEWRLDDPAQGASAIWVVAPPENSGEGVEILLTARGSGIAGRVRVRAAEDRSFQPAKLGEWRISGPYSASTGEEALDTDYIDPQAINLDILDAMGNPVWKGPPENFADGVSHTLPGKNCATYVSRTITCPSPRTMDLALDNRNAVRLWVNGRLTFDKEAQRGEVGPHPARVTIELHPGNNEILMKAVDFYDFNSHTFYFARLNETLGELPLDVEQALTRDATLRSEHDEQVVRSHYRSRHWAPWASLNEEEQNISWAMGLLEKQIPTTMVMEERAEPRPTQVLTRGQYDQPGEAVSPNVPEALSDWPTDAPGNRLGLAQWLFSPDQPLTARVAVNRAWQRFFGVGLVKTADDFGVQGSWPTHPELLDWLACTFIESGWAMKSLDKRIVMSATYRQDSRIRPELLEQDPANLLLARGPRYRLDAEQIRDSALAASGLLVSTLGGPSVRPYQPAGLWRDVAYGGGGLRYTAQEFFQDHEEKLYRRSMYTFWKRAAAPPGMLVFDAPNRDICTAQRSRSNTPLQALVLMNDVQFVEAARTLAGRIMAEGGTTTEERVAYASLLVLNRGPRPAEEQALMEQFSAQRDEFALAPDEAKKLLSVGESTYDPTWPVADLAAWTLVANALMNSDAAVTKY